MPFLRRLGADGLGLQRMMLSKRGAFIFCQTLTRSRSAPCIRPSEHLDHVEPRAERRVDRLPISRPMIRRRRSACAAGAGAVRARRWLSTMRGSSFGRRTASRFSEPAAMIALEADRLRAALGAGGSTFRWNGSTNSPVPCTHRHLAHLGHRGQAAGELADDLFLLRFQLGGRRRRGEADAEVGQVLTSSSPRRRAAAPSGMQPTFRHAPPAWRSARRAPSSDPRSAARNAAE